MPALDVRRAITLLFMVGAGCGESHAIEPLDAGRAADSGEPFDAGSARDGGRIDAGGGECPPNVFELGGMPCSTPDVSCGGPCLDECSFCNIMRCEDGVWQRLEAHPLPCFPCGEEEQCVSFDEYCLIAYSDVAGEPDLNECRELPVACADDRTCGCIEAEKVFFNECTDADGEITVEIYGG